LLQRRVFSARGLRLALAAACLAVLILAAGRATSADAGVSGQNDAWEVHFGTDPGELFNPQDLGVDPVDGSTYILSNNPAGTEVRIDKFSADGEPKGSVSVPRPEAGPESVPVGFVGIAVDHQLERFYLVEDEFGGDAAEPELTLAKRLLVYSTVPNASKELEPVGGGSINLVGATNSEDLVAPNEIHVDPHTGDILLSALEGGKPVIQRITSAGSRSTAYTEAGSELRLKGSESSQLNFGFDIGADGTTYVVAKTGEDESGPAAIKGFSLPPSFVPTSGALTLEPLPNFVTSAQEEGWFNQQGAFRITQPGGRGEGNGPQIAISKAQDGEETLFWKASTSPEEHEQVQIHGYSLQQQATSEVFGLGAAEEECAIETSFAALAGTKDGELMVLDQGQFVGGPGETPQFGLQVLRFGPGGEFCPGPAAGIQLKSGSNVVSTVAAGTNVTLDASSSELAGLTPSELVWTITKSGGSPQSFPMTGPPAPLTLPHVFTEEGDYTIQLGIKTSTAVPDIGDHFVAKPATLTVTAGGGSTGPTVSAVTPNHGPASGGNVVEITGAELANASKVEFGTGNSVTNFTEDTATTIKLAAPPGTAGQTVDVTVTTAAGTSPTGAGDQYTYEGSVPAGPTVSSVTPNHGPIAGGTLVKVVGTELSGATKVEFGTTAVSCPSSTAGAVCTLKSGTEIEVDAPAHAAGAVDVKVTTAAGTSPTGNGDAYTYDAPVVITHTLTIGKSGTGSGGVTCNGTSCATSYPAGTSVQLVATASAGSTFAGWGSGGGCSGTGGCTVVINADTTVNAIFNVTPSGGGDDNKGGGNGSTQSPGPTNPGSGVNPGPTTKTPAQKLAERQQQAIAKCKKKKGKAKAQCLKKAHQIGKPKKKSKAHKK
jgi:hypothetical protein